jgi:hypothetical protein
VKPGSGLSTIFHKLWTKAVGGERYEKSDWLALEKAVEALEARVKLFEDTIDLNEAEARVASSYGRDQDAAEVLAAIVQERGVGWQGERTTRQLARGGPRAGASDSATEKDDEVPEDFAQEHLYGLAALVYGYNEIAKQSDKFATRLYWRLMRETVLRKFIEKGGARIISGEGEILKLPSRPELPIYDSDLDAMRDLVAERDGTPSGCLCASIQRADPGRHFKGCPLRVEREEKP